MTYRGFVITMMKFIISSTETAPSWFVSAKRKIFAGIPRLDKILWNVSGRTGSSMQIKYAMASNNSTISVFSSVESSCSSLWFLEIEKTLDINPKWKVYLIENQKSIYSSIMLYVSIYMWNMTSCLYIFVLCLSCNYIILQYLIILASLNWLLYFDTVNVCWLSLISDNDFLCQRTHVYMSYLKTCLSW